MSRLDTHDDAVWDTLREEDVAYMLSDMFIRAAKEGTPRPTMAVRRAREHVFFQIVGRPGMAYTNAPAIVLVGMQPSTTTPLSLGYTGEKWADKSIESDDEEYCIHLAYRTVNEYASLPPDEGCRRLLTLQARFGQVVDYTAVCTRQLLSQVSWRAAYLPESQPTWLDQAAALEKAGKKEQSLDVIFNHLDDLLIASKFAECDAELLSIAPDMMSNAQLLTVLTATAGAKEHLRNRGVFYGRVKLILEARGADSKRLLVGLE